MIVSYEAVGASKVSQDKRELSGTRNKRLGKDALRHVRRTNRRGSLKVIPSAMERERNEAEGTDC